MKMYKGIGAAVLIAVLLLLGAQLLVRTYFSSLAAHFLKTNLHEAYGDSITFDTLLLNLLSSQADIEHVHITIPHGPAGGISTFTAESISINIPGKDLFSITSPAFDIFSVSRGAITLRNPVYMHRNPHTGASYHITAEQVTVDFHSTYPEILISLSSVSDLPHLLRKLDYASVEAYQVHMKAPQLIHMLKNLEQLLFEPDIYTPAAAAELVKTALPEGFLDLAGFLLPPDMLSEDERSLAHTIVSTTLMIMPGSDEVFTSSYMSFRTDRAVYQPDVYTVQGDITNDAGKVYAAGEMFFPEAKLEAHQNPWDTLEVRELFISIDELHGEIASRLGSDSFSFSYGR